ncbi:hypothetical protein GGI04_001199 [Coemansia thaxteri]|uniref:Transmembrane protein 19 n=1 Tax=Coemansia thaxteri TaxID=2663907 RepID=A0A9W8ECY8_9FUNG|nr:hypothetical protein H4R26_005068 [Coemansia thaxteri]KAJ2008306.1 hypothetical protein GGI04_001199 [Coemansia thaxteri]KAJ2324082.1 hypothetical protein GGH92_010761 [Coemansia sp. RSA 2673]KAJ2471146.1 hypothetical protein GGI02_002467 [Coemansia sp. RSA 2322]KAJ2478756.1 hypothetical protein EV174_004215 [Coemansia sp. RSA 2320]
MRAYFSIVLTALLSLASLQRRSLSKSGALAAVFIGLSTASNDNILFTVVLLAFFISSSFWTKYHAQAKARLDSTHAKASQRGWKQVMCNGCVGAVISLVYQCNFDGRRPEELSLEERKFMTLLIWGYVGFYSCCAADTWASELGTLSSNWPVLITTLKAVPPGTNGGISKLGIMSSFAGGAAIGLAADVALWMQYFGAYRSGMLPKIPYSILGSLLGMLGSLIDSMLGATVQASYVVEKRVVSDLSANELKHIKGASLVAGRDILSNNMVNVVASVTTSAIAIALQMLLF